VARPRKDGLDYFPHDVDATTDPKLEPAILMYGAAAYAFYFVHLEYCYRSADLSIDVSAAETGVEMRAVIQQKLRISAVDYEKILQTLLRHGAFDAQTYSETGKLTSAGIHKRAEKVLQKREVEASRYAQKVSVAEMGVETPQSITKKRTAQNSKKKNSNSLISSIDFDVFWGSYPKKVGKDAAKKSFSKVKVELSVLLDAIEKQKRSEQWTKDNGQFIPNPATWLNQGRWEDELPETESEKKGGISDASTDSNKWGTLSAIKKLG